MKQRFIKKFISVITAFVLLLGTAMTVYAEGNLAPVATATKVVIHKIKMDNLTGWPKSGEADGRVKGGTEDQPLYYDGNQIENIGNFFANTNAVELDGIKFAYWRVDDQAKFDALVAAPQNYTTLAAVKAHLDNADPTVTNATANQSGVTIDSLADGNYWFIELEANLEGKTLSKAAAVPFPLILPTFTADGERFSTDKPLHVYPKNTLIEKPDITKEIEGKEDSDTSTTDYTVGTDIPYVITTTIKPFARYKNLRWSDRMTEGLTYNKDLAVTIKVGDNAEEQLVAEDYTLVAVENGFDISFTEAGLAKVNNKEANTVITLKYSAELNESAIVNIPERNDVTFNYGNNPGHGNTPDPTKPNPDDASITVKKTFDANVVNKPVSIEVTLYNVQTGEVVTGQDNPVTLNEANGWTHKFTNLEADTEYFVKEKVLEDSGMTPEYGKEDGGVLTIKNYQDDNPPPITPEVPKVITYGKRFVKVDKTDETKTLANAKFNVARKVGDTDTFEYLSLKTLDEQAAELATYNEKEAAYQALVAKVPAAQEDEISVAKAARDTAYKALKMKWKWVEANDASIKAFVFTSGADGRFEVRGLAAGTYYLEEIQAPASYARLTEKLEFVVNESSWESTENAIDMHQKVNNTKIIIPQTGGMGTILFTMAGISLMLIAIFALKRRGNEEL